MQTVTTIGLDIAKSVFMPALNNCLLPLAMPVTPRARGDPPSTMADAVDDVNAASAAAIMETG